MDDVISSADGTKLAVRRIGRGCPVVMLHGSGGGLHSWARVGELLSDDYQVWLLARRGYGPSEIPAEVKSFAREVADVHAVLAAVRAQRGEPAHLVGSSYGATLALHAARSHRHGHPLAPRSLAVHEPPLFAAGSHLLPVLEQYRTLAAAGDTAAADLLFAEKVARVPPDLLALLARATNGQPDTGEANQSAIGSLHDLEALAGDDQDIGRWGSIDVPVLLMQGAQTWDPMPRTMDALAAALPHAERICWPGQSHFATSAVPDLVAATLRSFLQRHR